MGNIRGCVLLLGAETMNFINLNALIMISRRIPFYIILPILRQARLGNYFESIN